MAALQPFRYVTTSCRKNGGGRENRPVGRHAWHYSGGLLAESHLRRGFVAAMVGRIATLVATR
jgi:hypothetical protein